MPTLSRDRLRGTLDILILKTLTWGPRHGYAIARWLEESTRDTVTIEEGSLYPSLYRMEQREWVASEWGTTDTGRQAKFYKLTPAGRRQLKQETAEWRAFVTTIGRVLLVDS